MNKLINTIITFMVLGAGLSAAEGYEAALKDVRHQDGNGKGIAVEMTAATEMDGESWKTVKKETEGETFQVQLPNQRLFNTMKNGWGATVTEKDGAYYEVASAVPAMKDVNEYSVMFELADQYSQHPYQLQGGDIYQENGHAVIEITALNVETNEIERVKAIDSGNNLHVATVKFPADQDTSRDDIFLSSFAVAQ